jgi:hypothetical protein
MTHPEIRFTIPVGISDAADEIMNAKINEEIAAAADASPTGAVLVFWDREDGHDTEPDLISIDGFGNPVSYEEVPND